jgi:maltose O-acetyltransferase
MMALISRVFDVLASLRWRVRYRAYRSRYDVDRSFRFNGVMILLYGEGRIKLGADSYIGDYSTIQAAVGHGVSIGRGCMISHNVRIYTTTSVADADFSAPPVPQKHGDVRIGDYCWIGANVFIGPGVSIGVNSVIGANAVVTHDVGDNEIWAGVPARLLRKKAARA